MEKIRCINPKTGKIKHLPAHLANDPSYMAKMGFKKAEVEKPKEPAKKAPAKKPTTKATTKK